ncbi:unnamed protein product [Prorocentrum cordatum]|uniref:Uncharacterized protein n=1 Tax=Prorocentrum cordatum TaxID=2364126 RepID=A0ABN9SQB1_9DINO|nr:unnamed protein product [Polarella glacialis]
MLDRRAAHSSRPMDLGRRCVEFGPPLGVPRSLYEGVVEELFVKRGLVSPGGASPAESASIDYLAINEYTGGGGIESHVDTHTDCEQILSLSLLEDCVMELRRAPVAEEVTQPPRGPAELRLLLPRASLLVICGRRRGGAGRTASPSGATTSSAVPERPRGLGPTGRRRRRPPPQDRAPPAQALTDVPAAPAGGAGPLSRGERAVACAVAVVLRRRRRGPASRSSTCGGRGGTDCGSRGHLLERKSHAVRRTPWRSRLPTPALTRRASSHAAPRGHLGPPPRRKGRSREQACSSEADNELVTKRGRLRG